MAGEKGRGKFEFCCDLIYQPINKLSNGHVHFLHTVAYCSDRFGHTSVI